MFEWLSKLFIRKETAAEAAEVNDTQDVMREKPCLSCGKPILYDPGWKHIPNYCPECKKNYRAGTITRTCRKCGKTFTLPENVQYWPDYCQECRAKAPAQKITRKCRGCGKDFSFPSTVRHWPNYCRECQAKRKKK